MNRLSLEKSPYLLQHAANPVDWFPWGGEAFRMARERDCPIFLSIGYATCHWCHVMEHESFEDEAVAALMNRTLVPVKVDREERPDIDEQYMTVCNLLTGSGGWPLTIVMTPEGLPFFAATYIPRKSMLELIPQLGKIWTERRADVIESAGTVLEALRTSVARGDGGELPGSDVLDRGFSELRAEFDEEHGGFGRAPKFPTPHNLYFLLRHHERTGDPEALRMVERTLTAMRRGGVYDQVGYGFHRYSTDERWLVPHFEKMLYDQALLAMASTEALQVTGGELYAQTVRETLAYVERDLLLPEGAFASAEDADSEGEEGRFYLWGYQELQAILSPQELRDLESACAVAPGGNYTDPFGNGGGNILHLARADARIEDDVRAKLFDRRARRPRPLRDDKVLADWNGLAIAAFARASRALGDPRLAVVASRAAAFLQGALRARDGRLLHRYRAGEAGIPGFAADYAFLAWGLTELYEATLEPPHLAAALELCSSLVDLFVDRDERGGARLSMTACDGEALLVRPGSATDGALPSAVSVTVLVLLRLARMTGRAQLEDIATSLVRSLSSELSRHPRAFTFLLCALDFLQGPTQEIVITGTRGAPDTETMLDVVRRTFLPRGVLLFRAAGSGEEMGGLAPFTRALRGVQGRATAYVCRGRSCGLPTTDPQELARLITS